MTQRAATLLAWQAGSGSSQPARAGGRQHNTLLLLLLQRRGQGRLHARCTNHAVQLLDGDAHMTSNTARSCSSLMLKMNPSASATKFAKLGCARARSLLAHLVHSAVSRQRLPAYTSKAKQSGIRFKKKRQGKHMEAHATWQYSHHRPRTHAATRKGTRTGTD